MKRYPLLFLLASMFFIGCGKKDINHEHIVGNWIQTPYSAFSMELQLLQDGTLYTQYLDTGGVTKIDTGYYELSGAGSGIYFYFSWGPMGGNWVSEDDEILLHGQPFTLSVMPQPSVRFSRQ